MHIKKMISKIIENGKQEDMVFLGDLFSDLIYDLEDKDEKMYKNIEFSLYKKAYGNHLTEELAKEWVAGMENKDGTKGQHWDYATTTSVKPDKNFNDADWYSSLNMIYSDYYNEKFDTNTYVQLANDWLSDKDVGSEKTLKYYMFIVDCNK
ncbi:hypothetical protein EOL99_03470 [Candidatus Falkowbacteria bacterium]|nr:hypothetical protein [Candidatus Falkowbacteria bacterium]